MRSYGVRPNFNLIRALLDLDWLKPRSVGWATGFALTRPALLRSIACPAPEEAYEPAGVAQPEAVVVHGWSRRGEEGGCSNDQAESDEDGVLRQLQAATEQPFAPAGGLATKAVFPMGSAKGGGGEAVAVGNQQRGRHRLWQKRMRQRLGIVTVDGWSRRKVRRAAAYEDGGWEGTGWLKNPTDRPVPMNVKPHVRPRLSNMHEVVQLVREHAMEPCDLSEWIAFSRSRLTNPVIITTMLHQLALSHLALLGARRKTGLHSPWLRRSWWLSGMRPGSRQLGVKRGWLHGQPVELSDKALQQVTWMMDRLVAMRGRMHKPRCAASGLWAATTLGWVDDRVFWSLMEKFLVGANKAHPMDVAQAAQAVVRASAWLAEPPDRCLVALVEQLRPALVRLQWPASATVSLASSLAYLARRRPPPPPGAKEAERKAAEREEAEREEACRKVHWVFEVAEEQLLTGWRGLGTASVTYAAMAFAQVPPKQPEAVMLTLTRRLGSPHAFTGSQMAEIAWSLSTLATRGGRTDRLLHVMSEFATIAGDNAHEFQATALYSLAHTCRLVGTRTPPQLQAALLERFRTEAVWGRLMPGQAAKLLQILADCGLWNKRVVNAAIASLLSHVLGRACVHNQLFWPPHPEDFVTFLHSAAVFAPPRNSTHSLLSVQAEQLLAPAMAELPQRQLLDLVWATAVLDAPEPPRAAAHAVWAGATAALQRVRPEQLLQQELCQLQEAALLRAAAARRGAAAAGGRAAAWKLPGTLQGAAASAWLAAQRERTLMVRTVHLQLLMRLDAALQELGLARSFWQPLECLLPPGLLPQQPGHMAAAGRSGALQLRRRQQQVAGEQEQEAAAELGLGLDDMLQRQYQPHRPTGPLRAHGLRQGGFVADAMVQVPPRADDPKQRPSWVLLEVLDQSCCASNDGSKPIREQASRLRLLRAMGLRVVEIPVQAWMDEWQLSPGEQPSTELVRAKLVTALEKKLQMSLAPAPQP